MRTIVLTRRLLLGVSTASPYRLASQVAQRDIGHRLHADRQRGLVQVEPRVVVTPDQPALRVLAADEPERARHLLQEVGEILGAHHQRRLAHAVLADDLGRFLAHQLGHLRVVDRRRVAPRVGVVDRAAHGRGDAARQRPDPLLEQIAVLGVEGAHRPAQLGGVGDDVERLPGLKRADGDDRLLGRVDHARDQRLQRGHDLRADHDRVDRVVRLRPVAALAPDDHVEAVGRGHRRTRPQLDHANRIVLVDVQAERGVDLRVLQHAGVDHRLGASRRRLLRRLKQHLHRPGKLVAAVHQQPRHAKQHRGVRVVAAGVHDARRLRPVLDVVLFENRQGIHVGAQEDGLPLARPPSRE